MPVPPKVYTEMRVISYDEEDRPWPHKLIERLVDDHVQCCVRRITGDARVASVSGRPLDDFVKVDGDFKYIIDTVDAGCDIVIDYRFTELVCAISPEAQPVLFELEADEEPEEQIYERSDAPLNSPHVIDVLQRLTAAVERISMKPLKNLGHILNGDRNECCQLHRTRTLHLFAGAGGGILGGILLGHQCVGAVEIDPYCQRVLHQRQKDGILPWFPIFADVCAFDGRPWRGKVDRIEGGFPCQGISIAGEGKGIEGDPRSNLWTQMGRIICEVRPQDVLVENSPELIRKDRGMHIVLRDLAQMGYDAEWGVLGADDAGAPHRRKRIWIRAKLV